MCGIAGIVHRDRERPAARADVVAMCDIQRHRGPDAVSYYDHGPLCLGHRRLAILDLSEAGTQPLHSHDGRYIITFNGEIYNYLELREELAKTGARFRTQTDTEVILEAYRAWGADCVGRFNGMWAFALYDTAEDRLVVSRDRFGIKPFYYLLDSDGFVFASEIKAILAVRPGERKPHWATLARFIPTGLFADGEETFFANVRSLPPGYNAVYDLAAGTFRLSRYWSVEPERFTESWRGRDPVEVLRELLASAVQLHLRSDVPVGTCLSGGVDSSAIVCLMSRQRGGAPVHTFSGIYADKACDEKEYVDRINAVANTVPCPVFPEPNGDLVRDLTAITWHQDNPTAGPGLYTQYHVMRRAKPEVTVILDGQGSDELFGGYLWYFAARLRDEIARGLGGRLRAAGLLAAIRWLWGAASVPRPFRGRVGRVLQGVLARSAPRLPIAVEELVHPDLKARAANGPPLTRTTYPPQNGEFPDLLCDQLLNTSLPALLHYEDRNSMAFSLESRVPFLDYRVVEFALSLPAEYKIRGTWTKWVLRKAAADVLPAEVAWRRSKMGYPTPMARWFRKPTERPAVEAVLFASAADRGLLRPDKLRQVWELHQEGHDYSWLLYRALTLELWYRHYMDGFVPAPAVPN